MESKRKASGANGTANGPDTPDRAAKRRKLIEEYGDLSNGETAESTTAYGLNILESIRTTADKNGRTVAPYFEQLPPRNGNAEYYKLVRLPLSLEIIEQKLKNGEYPNLSTLEGDFKRLVANCKDTSDRNSTLFGDAERVRKAVSNLMVKHNPAYKSGNYQAVATPLPPTPEPDAGDEDEDAEGEEDVDIPPARSFAPAKATKAVPAARAKKEEEEEEEEEDEDGEQDDEDEEANEEDDSSSRRRAGRRRGRTGGSSQPAPTPRKVPTRNSNVKADHHYENVPFEGLSFQEAQEKIVEELLRKKDDENEGYLLFDVFVYLPPRTLRDYYEVIAEPLSLKALQKQVKGQHGRGEATYVSDFKSWAAFEDQASLIWKNAYHYNEDGSEIFVMAQELERVFRDYVKEAKKHVQDPPQPKIKLKVSQATETPGHPKKITIHVGGKVSTTGSPAPATAQSGDGEVTRNGTPLGRNPFTNMTSIAPPLNFTQLEKARSMSASAGPPSPATTGVAKLEDSIRPSPVVTPQPATTVFQQFAPPVAQQTPIMPNGVAPYQPPVPRKTAGEILDAQKKRPRPIQEEEALMPKIVISSHPDLQVENPVTVTIPANRADYQQQLVINFPSSQFRLQLKPYISSFLEAQQREWKLNVLHDGTRLYPMPQRGPVPYDRRNEPVFDALLKFGTNRLDISLVAALPKGEKAANGLNMELERTVVYLNVLKR